MTPTIAVAMGTRPEVIKLAPVIERLRDAGWCSVVLVASGQHGDLLPQTLAACGLHVPCIPPAPVGQHGPRELVDALSDRLRPMLARRGLSLVLVHGDTATALAGARAAADLGIPVGHVEAGLRTYDIDHPFPEEMHRQAIAKLARLHFAPTQAAAANLMREGIPADAIAITGNTVVDALLREAALPAPPPTAERLAVVTLHRRELKPHLDQVVAGLLAVIEAHADLRMVIPIHPNPAVSAPLTAAFAAHSRVDIVPPLPHAVFLGLLRRAAVVITDSGGVQEEAATLGVPLVIVRKVTERPEVLASARSAVVGFQPAAIDRAVAHALTLARSAGYDWVVGNGRAAALIESRLRLFLCGPGR